MVKESDLGTLDVRNCIFIFSVVPKYLCIVTLGLMPAVERGEESSGLVHEAWKLKQVKHEPANGHWLPD